MENLVELMEEGKWNQKCVHGHLIPGHSVYCHSENPKAPRKCHHTWFFGNDVRDVQDEDYPYFELNPNFK